MSFLNSRFFLKTSKKKDEHSKAYALLDDSSKEVIDQLSVLYDMYSAHDFSLPDKDAQRIFAKLMKKMSDKMSNVNSNILKDLKQESEIDDKNRLNEIDNLIDSL